MDKDDIKKEEVKKAEIVKDDKSKESNVGDTESQIRTEFRRKNRKKKIKKIIIWIIVLAVIIGGSQLYNYYNINRRLPWQPDKKAALNTPTYTDVPVAELITEPEVDITGVLAANDLQNVVLRSDGAIESINVKEGDHVKKGDTLVTVDDTNEKYQIAKLESDLQAAKLTGNANTIALLELQLKNAKNNLDYTKATANFDGVVAYQDWELGDYNSITSTSNDNMIIADLSKFKATVVVDEMDINYVQVGQKANLSFSSLPGMEVEARVSKIPMLGRYSKQGYGVMDVEITIDNPPKELKTGFTFSGKIISENKESLTVVDQAALIIKNDKTYLNKKAADGSLSEVEVTIRYLGEGKCQILSGDVEIGDTVVIKNAPTFEQMVQQNMSMGI